MKSILFITTDFIDRKFSFDRLFKNKFSLKPLNWEQIKEIADAGIEIGSHTLSHPKLTRLDNKTAYREIMDSKNKIEDIVCKKVISFAYSYGWRDSFDSRIKEIVKDCGYQRAYANIMGFNYANSDLYELRRIRIDSNDNMFRFKMKIKGAYNYIDSLKYCLNFKNVKE